jgi:hypothetical protein
MRHRSPAAALVALLASALPAAAQQAADSWVALPRSADTGKSIIYDPQFVARADDDRRLECSPGLQCRFQLLGVIENHGAVELRAKAFTW